MSAPVQNHGAIVFDLRRTVSLILLALGTFLMLFGGIGTVIPPPKDVSPETTSTLRIVFLITAVIGSAVFGWGVLIRRTKRAATRRGLWIIYFAFLGLLGGLALAVADDLVRILSGIPAGRRQGRAFAGGFLLIIFLLGPILVRFRFRLRRSRGGRPQTSSPE